MKTTTVSETPIKENVHCIYNNTDSIVRILVVKAPRPTTATIVL